MTKYFFLFLVSILLIGCAPNRALKYFEKETLYAKSLQYTNKCDILWDEQVKVMMSATYLNSVDSKWNDDYENFIIGVYVVETAQNNEQFYQNEQFELSLNGTPNFFIEPLTKENEMFDNLPLNNAWANYFIVKFNPESSPKPIKVNLLNDPNNLNKQKENIPSPYELKLELNHSTLGSCAVSFQEE